MAAENRHAAEAIAFLQALEAEPYSFDFFYVLRRLECFYPEKPRVGEAAHAKDDIVRLGQEPSLAFAPASLSAFHATGNRGKPHLQVCFFGLLGPNGPLPLHVTEYIVRRWVHQRDRTFACFLDLFHHRLLSLYYRAWASGEPAVDLDRQDVISDRFSTYVGATFGMGMPTFRNRDRMPDHAKLHFAGRLAQSARNAEGLRMLIEHCHGLPAQIREFVGGWLPISEASRLRLGVHGRSSIGHLGRHTTLGARVWSIQHKFRLVLGPMTLAQYRQFLPWDDALQRLIAVVRNYIGDELEWELTLVLARNEVPTLCLGTGVQLGWTTWLGKRRTTRDADDLTLTALALRKPAPEARTARREAAALEMRKWGVAA